MTVSETYSHLNGLEFLLVHKPKLWEEILGVIEAVDAEECKTKKSRERQRKGRLLYSPIDMNKAIDGLLKARRWRESRVSYWVSRSEKLIRKTLTMSPEDQKKQISPRARPPSTATTRPISSRTVSPSRCSSGSMPSWPTTFSSSISPSTWATRSTSASRYCR